VSLAIHEDIQDQLTRFIFLARAILNEEWANPVIDWEIISFRLIMIIGKERRTSSVLYMLIATPGALKS